MPGKPLLLDLFCGAGGAAMGYHRAGFGVVGIDIKPQPRYPFEFRKADALALLELLIGHPSARIHGFPYRLRDFDAIHASPPCQGYSRLARLHKHIQYPMLIEPVRNLLVQSGLPYVIENVEGAPLLDPVKLCGGQFNLTAWWPGVGMVGLRRHRLFESSIEIYDAGPHDHRLYSVPVYGHGAGGNRAKLKGPGCAKAARDVMQIDWMTREELNEAIPPAYTEYIGTHLLADLCIPEAA